MTVILSIHIASGIPNSTLHYLQLLYVNKSIHFVRIILSGQFWRMNPREHQNFAHQRKLQTETMSLFYYDHLLKFSRTT